jgi:hypothetical protein
MSQKLVTCVCGAVVANGAACPHCVREVAQPELLLSVPHSMLKKWKRDLDACQKVIWLRGGFDPAYCKDAQDCIKEMDVLLVKPASADKSCGACGGCKDGCRLERESPPVQVCAMDALQERLTIAEQRNAVIVKLLNEAYQCGDRHVFGTDLNDRLSAALNHAESGASHE